jgi:predicted amidohydrolase YtcJ
VGAGLALEAYTRGGARAAHHDDRLGVLRRGFDADLAVLADDPTTVDPAEIASIGVLATVVDGRPAHDPGGLLGRWGEVRPA